MRNQSWLKTFLLVTLITMLFWALSPFVLAAISFPMPDVNWTTRGTLGDSFGAVNTLFNGIGLAALIATLLLQAKGIDLQTKQLIESQSEQNRIALSQITAAKLQGLSEVDPKNRTSR